MSIDPTKDLTAALAEIEGRTLTTTCAPWLPSTDIPRLLAAIRLLREQRDARNIVNAYDEVVSEETEKIANAADDAAILATLTEGAPPR